MATKPPYIALMLLVMYYFEWWNSTPGTELAAANRSIEGFRGGIVALAAWTTRASVDTGFSKAGRSAGIA
jgi:hypothetical protein